MLVNPRSEPARRELTHVLRRAALESNPNHSEGVAPAGLRRLPLLDE